MDWLVDCRSSSGGYLINQVLAGSRSGSGSESYKCGNRVYREARV